MRRRRRRTLLARVARASAVAAAVAVLATVVVAAVVLGRQDATVPTGDASVPVQDVSWEREGVQVRLEVPEEEAGWRLSAPDTVTGFATSDGGAVTLTQPMYYLRGWCRDERTWSNRAFAGVVDPVVGDDVRSVNQAVGQRWTDALAWDEASGTMLPATVPEQRRLELENGTKGWVSRSEVDLSGADVDCAPPRAALWLLSLRAGDRIATVVVAADLAVDHALTDKQVERVLASVALGAG